MKNGTINVSLLTRKDRPLKPVTRPANDLAVQAASDARAFINLYECFFERVYNYLRYRIDDQKDVEDVCAQIFERLLTRLNTYRPERGDFEPWLFALARNELRSFWRKQNRKPLALEQIAPAAAKDPPLEETLLHQQKLEWLEAGLQRLDSRSRDVLGLKFGAGLKNRQIADLTGLSESHVGVLVFRALNKLRIDLEAAASGAPQEVNNGRA